MNNKDLFVKIIKTIQKQNSKDSKFAEAVSKLNMLETEFFYDNTLLTGLLIDIAEQLIPNEESRAEWVSWFCYECDFGKDNAIAWDKEGVEYTIKTPEELWDFLIK